ncbi:hypothetical protein CIB48_g1137 [Xylaria polymorpha]|nr:hypothetical protein CIB48_g1137 [Xylaria polymorpha]
MTTERNLGFDVNAPGTSLFIIQLVFLALAWITSLMRAFVKIVLLRKATLDDYVMLLALLGYTATGYFVLSAIIDGGLGRPDTELSRESLKIMLRSWFGNMALAGPVSGLARVSIALFLLRIAVKKWQRLVLHVVIGATTVMTIVSATLVWGSFAVAMDWILGLLPIAMSKYYGTFGLTDSRKAVSISAVVELALGIIAGCIAILPPLFKRIGLQFGSSPKRADFTDTIPWQRSFAGPEPPRHQGAENIIMMSPRRLESAQDVEAMKDVNIRRPRMGSPSAKRVLSSSNWDIEVDGGRSADDGLAPRPSGKNIQIRTYIQVNSQPSSSKLSVSTADFAEKPLPPPPPAIANKGPINIKNRFRHRQKKKFGGLETYLVR